MLPLPRVLRVHVRAAVRPTEDLARVRQAVRNLFPDAVLAESPHEIVGDTTSLARLAELVRNHHIPDTARSVMLHGLEGATTRFLLGKQAAFVGYPGFGSQPSALGEIEVSIGADDERELLYAIYEVGFDTTVDESLARVPREYRPMDDGAKPPAGE